MREPVERRSLPFAHLSETPPMKLHMGVILKQNIIRRIDFTLKLLTGENVPMATSKLLEVFADNEAEVFDSHLVDTLMKGRNELDQLDRLPKRRGERFRQKHLGDGSPVPHVLEVSGASSLNAVTSTDILVPCPDSDRDMAESEVFHLQTQPCAAFDLLLVEPRERQANRVQHSDSSNQPAGYPFHCIVQSVSVKVQ
jgi:hypothetical protein